jgi:hypothetical protein
MGVGGISFFQQDQNYWNTLQNQNQASSAEASLISVMSTAETSRETGLSSIANQEALTRTNNQIAALEKNLTGTSSSSSAIKSGSAAAAPTTPNATGIGTVPLARNTSLLTLGIPQNATISVSAGNFTTEYASTGSDTVGDLMNAINANVAGNAYVTATINTSGKLVISSKDTTDTVSVGGTFASDLGFGNGNTTFRPNPTVAKVTPQYSAGAATPATSSGAGKRASALVSASTLNATSAAGILSASGITGTLVNMLA